MDLTLKTDEPTNYRIPRLRMRNARHNNASMSHSRLSLLGDPLYHNFSCSLLPIHSVCSGVQRVCYISWSLFVNLGTVSVLFTLNCVFLVSVFLCIPQSIL